ncbi:MAG: hypothetical protein GTO45_36830 [Candidatus Aminicenantes bacterium]|nr:hypothetical protein [Candidatus Aminicenantes bacterium]NIM78212.1 hypothetical protein [Candidatus Aminicenantes bacterium]NIN23718.1 hypothetical protein [Candidatus Aminicenantes bacterium]NIN47425.1 hypothetical protein [Candidatus Aminicenantes bacterium]NIN90353.1 hypothetical protein [Candidatus Aminicenantes bacterium]
MKRKTKHLKTSLCLYLMVFTSFVGLFALCGCLTLDFDDNGNIWDGNGIIGSGQVIEEFRQVANFDRICIRGSCKLFVRKSPTQELRLVGEDNILPIIETYVEGDTLVIGSERSYRSEVGVTVYASMEEIREFSIAGACDIVGEESFTTDTLDLEILGAGNIDLEVTAQTISTVIRGAGNVTLRGSARQHMVEIAGSGNIEALDLEVQTYDIVIAGFGECWIFVTERLDAVISGTGTIYYQGEPAVINSQIAGTGKLVKL